MRKITISGAGAMAREAYFLALSLDFQVEGFLCDKTPIGTSILHTGHVVLGTTETSVWPTVIAIGSPQARRNLARQQNYITLIGKTVNKEAGNQIGEGSIICDSCVLTTNVTIGRHVIVNIGATVSHDVQIEDFCTISPGVVITGNCVIGEACDIGAGAILIPKVHLPPNGIIGAGTIVTRTPQLPPGTQSYVIVGNPGKIIKINGETLVRD